MSTQLYFAYGSNLNQEDFHAWCKRRNYPKGLLRFQSVAYLPDFDLASTYRSPTRNGGVLDLKDRPGQLVTGVLFEVQSEGWMALDEKEGAPLAYQRVDVSVMDDRGNSIIASTYRVAPNRKERFVQPTPEYVRIVEAGLNHWGLSTETLIAAASDRPTSCPDGFFFYGTLMRGEQRFSALQPFGIECVLLASTFGRLLDLGAFPGLVDTEETESTVQGEFVRLREPEKAISILDAIEGFRGFGRTGSLYRRTRIGVDVGDGRIRDAWTYCLESGSDRATQIQSGDWRAHCGRQKSFLTKLAVAHSRGDQKTVAERIASTDPFRFGLPVTQAVQSLLPLDRSLASGLLSERKLAQASGLWAAIP